MPCDVESIAAALTRAPKYRPLCGATLRRVAGRAAARSDTDREAVKRAKRKLPPGRYIIAIQGIPPAVQGPLGTPKGLDNTVCRMNGAKLSTAILVVPEKLLAKPRVIDLGEVYVVHRDGS